MNYIVLDIEWYHDSDVGENDGNNYILQIGTVRLNDRYEKVDHFFKLVKPYEISRISNSILSSMHLSKKNLEEAKDFADVMRRFNLWCKNDEIVIVWSEQALRVLIDECKRNNIKYPFKSTIYLHQLFDRQYGIEHEKSLSFEKACENLDILTRKELLHISKFDSDYCASMFVKMIKKSMNKERNLHKDICYYAFPRSNLFHKDNCFYVKSRLPSHHFSFYSDAIKMGLLPCKKCNNKMNDDEQEDILNLARLEAICNSNGFSWRLVGDKMMIQTHISNWFFDPYDSKIVLYHENSNLARNNHSFSNSYHKQDKTFTSPYDALDYIKRHDVNKIKRDIERNSQRRVEKLFRQIENGS